MEKHSLKEWIATTRYWSFPVSTMPLIVTFAYLFGFGLIPGGVLPWVILAVSLLGVVSLHAAGNLLSDWFDFRSGVDSKEALVPSLPIGLITVSVLHANNTLDILTDGVAGIKTFAMLIGEKASVWLYRC